mmetsp:Transcript_12459/g.15364  ORF Transcript_12459/g.15364 Transcript_12459/m.15364 type:complete len:375 (-) Transcript_12459:274-1398(-)
MLNRHTLAIALQLISLVAALSPPSAHDQPAVMHSAAPLSAASLPTPIASTTDDEDSSKKADIFKSGDAIILFSIVPTKTLQEQECFNIPSSHQVRSILPGLSYTALGIFNYTVVCEVNNVNTNSNAKEEEEESKRRRKNNKYYWENASIDTTVQIPIIEKKQQVWQDKNNKPVESTNCHGHHGHLNWIHRLYNTNQEVIDWAASRYQLSKTSNEFTTVDHGTSTSTTSITPITVGKRDTSSLEESIKFTSSTGTDAGSVASAGGQREETVSLKNAKAFLPLPRMIFRLPLLKEICKQKLLTRFEQDGHLYSFDASLSLPPCVYIGRVQVEEASPSVGIITFPKKREKKKNKTLSSFCFIIKEFELYVSSFEKMD